MSRTLFVHVGPMKTATTAIQASLGRHDNSVVIYPKVGIFGEGSHHGLVFSFFNAKRKPPNDEGIARHFERIRQEAGKSDKNIVISSETLTSHNRDIGAFVRTLLPYVDCGPGDVELVFAVREHFERAASLYNHYTRARDGTLQCALPDDYLRIRTAELCYAPLVRQLTDTGFKVTALNYHPSCSWVERFLRHIGFPEHKVPKNEEKLVGFSTKTLVAILAANNTLRPRKARNTFRNRLMRMSELRKPSGFIFGREASEEADHMFAEDRKLIHERYGIKISSPNLATTPNAFSLSEEEFAEVANAAQGLGPPGQNLATFARQFVRGSTR